ncbi:MAG: lamin tail domain-containing protein [Deltaproteobacteria bacterium]|nr:lamin tail domain-containing protein [Deltaproteobacteria bacterium]
MRPTWIALALLAACGDRKPPTDADPVTDTDAATDADTDADTDTDPALPIDTANPDFLLVINEVLADAAVADANCDGTIESVDDEFVEIVNAGGIPIDLSGAELIDLTGTRHLFPAGSILEPLGAVVVFGGGTPTFDGSNPAAWCAALPAGVVTQTASTGATGFNNDGDTLTLVGPSGTVLGAVVYGPEGDGAVSLNLDPELDPAGRWVLHDTLSSADWSPGRRATGEAFSETPAGTGGTDTGPVFFPAGVLINEINADPSTVDGDASCDGVIDSADDEFLELYNPTPAAVDLSGWTVTDDTSAAGANRDLSPGTRRDGTPL